VSLWGLPRRKIHAVCGLCGLSFLCGDLLFATGRTLPVWVCAAAVAAVFIPFIVSGYNTIWQLKLAPAAQGRVLAVADMFRSMPKPVGYLIAGPIADRLLEPAMQTGGALTPALWLVGGNRNGRWHRADVRRHCRLRRGHELQRLSLPGHPLCGGRTARS
jgi:hypothetical protein